MDTNHVQTQVGAAIAKLMNVTVGGQPIVPNTVDPMHVQGKAPKAKREVMTKEQKADARFGESLCNTLVDLQGVCSVEQMLVFEQIGIDALKRKAESDAWDVAFAKHVAALHPSGKVTHDVYAPIVSALRVHFDQYPATCYRNAVRAMHKRTFGDAPPAWLTSYLPTAQDSRAKGGIKGYSPKKWIRGIDSTMETLAERLNRCPKADVDPAVLRAFIGAHKALVAAQKALDKAVAKQAAA